MTFSSEFLFSNVRRNVTSIKSLTRKVSVSLAPSVAMVHGVMDNINMEGLISNGNISGYRDCPLSFAALLFHLNELAPFFHSVQHLA